MSTADRVGSIFKLMQHCKAQHRFPDDTVTCCADLPLAVRGVSLRLRWRMVVAMWRQPIPGARRPWRVRTTASFWCRELRGREGGASWAWVHAR
jgi:hypothetical protein